MDIDIQWGGYYASRESGELEFRVFRILDFNRQAYHVALFREKFASMPTLEQVMRLSPYIGHAPIDSRGLLRREEINLLGGAPLTEQDLEGYRLYLEHYEVGEKEISELFRNLVKFCGEPPMKLTLSLRGGELAIEER